MKLLFYSKQILALWLLCFGLATMVGCKDNPPPDQSAGAMPHNTGATVANDAAPTTPQPPSGPVPKDLQFKTLKNPDGTWGYDLLGDGRLMIHQPNIPALPGNAGFATEAQATRVAQAALQKIKKGESLPTLSVEEVRQLMAN